MTAPGETELAMRELQHRMGNVFQVVGGLLAREARDADPLASLVLRKAQAQIAAFALLHRALDDAKTVGEPDVCAAAYLTDLCTHLRAACLQPFGFGLETALDGPCPIDESRCRTLGLIVTELVLNAAKHAFVDRRNGVVGVCLGRIGAPQTVVLGVMDDGCGMAEARVAAGQGMGFVRMLTRSLGGECRVETGPGGTRIAITAPVAP